MSITSEKNISMLSREVESSTCISKIMSKQLIYFYKLNTSYIG